MSKIDELINTLCPDGVEYKTLGEVCNIVVGGEPPDNVTKEKTSKNQFAIFGNGKEIYGYTDTFQIDIDATVISSIGANTGTVFYRKAFFTPIIRLKVLLPKETNILSKYLFYACNTIEFNNKKSSVPNMSSAVVVKHFCNTTL